MSTIQITEVFQGPALAPGVTITSVSAVVTDASGAVQTSTLTGSEIPTPWSVSLTVASGAGSVSSTSTDSTGAVSTPIVQPYTTGATGTPALALSGTTVTVTAP